jgi:hypothetical protein
MQSDSMLISLRTASLLFSSLINTNFILNFFYKKLSIFYFNVDITSILIDTSNLPATHA